MAWVIAARRAGDSRREGGKIARQALLAARGFPVPPFFCVTAEAFRAAIGPHQAFIAAELAGLDHRDAAAVERAAAAVAARITSIPLAGALEREVLRLFDRTFGAGTLVAVRASMVGRTDAESEDGSDNPFAGVSETFLFVRRDEVLNRVRGCWASAFSAHALAYRLAHGLAVDTVAVAVAVQAMIASDRSFVLFTCEPKSGRRDAVIAASYGVGEGVVQERVAVDHYFVALRGGEVKAEIADKAERLVLDRARGAGLAMEPVPAERRRRPCLDEAEIRAVVALGRRIEALFGHPQDIEGAIDAAGRLWLLQARPIVLDHDRTGLWTTANVSESYPGVSTALTFTFAQYFYRVIFHDQFRRMGVPRRLLDRNSEALARMLGYIDGHVYYNVAHFYRLLAQDPLFSPVGWEQMIGLRSSYLIDGYGLAERRRRGLRVLWARLGGWVRGAVELWTSRRRFAEFHGWWDGLMRTRRGRSFDARDPMASVRDFFRVWSEVGERWGLTLRNDAHLAFIHGTTQALFRRWGLDQDGDDGLLSDLLCGGERLMSTEAILSAVRLAERVRGSPHLRERFAEGSPEALWEALLRGELGELAGEVQAHLARFGDRGLQELKMEQPNMRDRPWELLRVVRAYVERDLSADALAAAEVRLRAAAEARLRRRLRWHPLRRLIISQLLGRLRDLIANRENSRYCRSELFGYSRNIFRSLGRYLVERRHLDEVDDVVHLTQDELLGAFDGTGVTRDLGAVARLRKHEHATRAAAEAPAELVTTGATLEIELGASPLTEARTEQLKGLGSSAGLVRGRARVVLDPARCPDLGEDAILIARETDPGWLFLMLAARGIIVERGSMLSHTAITGRKLGVPTIVAVTGATRLIADGALVEMDGGSGIIRLLDAGPGPVHGESDAKRGLLLIE